MVKRKTIGTNPLDAVVPPLNDGKKPESSRKSENVKPERILKQRLTVHLPVELIERAKNSVYWTPGLTLAGLAEMALRKELDSLEEEKGSVFPTRKEELKGGRPLK